MTTIALVLLGMGPMALAIARVVAQLGATSVQFGLARVRPRFGLDRTIVRSALAFGVPLAAGNLLSWALLSVDKVVVGRNAGEVSLGVYVLAFNIASWPMTVIGQVVRSVTLPAFARQQIERQARLGDLERPPDRSLSTALGYAWVAALPAGVILAAFSTPVVGFLYGPKWAASAAVLAALGTFGAIRVLLDVAATYLLALGASRSVLISQMIWMAALIPAVLLGVALDGGVGAGWSHVAVALLVVAPTYAVLTKRAGADLGAALRLLWPPVVAMVPGYVVARAVQRLDLSDWLTLTLGGVLSLVVYALALLPWLRRLRRGGRGPAPAAVAPDLVPMITGDATPGVKQ